MDTEARKARLEEKARLARAAREPLPRKYRTGRVVTGLFVAVALGGALAGLRLAGDEQVASTLRALAMCADAMERGRAVDLCEDERGQSVEPPP